MGLFDFNWNYLCKHALVKKQTQYLHSRLGGLDFRHHFVFCHALDQYKSAEESTEVISLIRTLLPPAQAY